MAKAYLVWCDINGTAKPRPGELVLLAMQDGSYVVGRYDSGRLFAVERADGGGGLERPTHWAYISPPHKTRDA
jgi:hypothetical protein